MYDILAVIGVLRNLTRVGVGKHHSSLVCLSARDKYVTLELRSNQSAKHYIVAVTTQPLPMDDSPEALNRAS